MGWYTTLHYAHCQLNEVRNHNAMHFLISLFARFICCLVKEKILIINYATQSHKDRYNFFIIKKYIYSMHILMCVCNVF